MRIKDSKAMHFILIRQTTHERGRGEWGRNTEGAVMCLISAGRKEKKPQQMMFMDKLCPFLNIVRMLLHQIGL